MCLSTGRPYGVRRVQILTTPETESPKKAWFIQSGLCDLAAGKGFFNSLALMYTQISGGFQDCLEGGQGRRANPEWAEEGRWGRILAGRRGFIWIIHPNLDPSLDLRQKQHRNADYWLVQPAFL